MKLFGFNFKRVAPFNVNPQPSGPKPPYPPAPPPKKFRNGGYTEFRLDNGKPRHPATPKPVEDSTRTAAVDKSYPWIKINAATPLRRKLQLINRPAGVATYGELTHTGKQFWTHYALMPTFADDE